MFESIEVIIFFIDISVERLYRAWLDSEGHIATTGSLARIEMQICRPCTLWGG